MAARQLQMEAIAHNLANVDTAGYKRVQAVATGQDCLSFVRSFLAGAVEGTGRELDLALNGDGFFSVRNDDGTIAYTRDGAFGVDAEGRLVTAGGRRVVPEIIAPEAARVVWVSVAGEVLAAVGGAEPTVIGRLQIARFANPSGLVPIGENLFAASPASGEAVVGNPAADGFAAIVPRALERSNVDAADEMVSALAAIAEDIVRT
jgi:flagellar basal-body rod protein FlgG